MEKLVVLRPNFAEAWRLLAAACEETGDMRRAAQAREKADELAEVAGQPAADAE